MSRSRLVAIVVTALVGVLGLGVPPGSASAPEHSSRLPGTPLLTYHDEDCTEVAYVRGGQVETVRALVPERFALRLLPGTPARTRLLVNEVTCESVGVAAPAAANFPRQVTTIIVSASVTLPDGSPGSYVLQYATQNPVQAAAFSALGWRVDRLGPGSSMTVARDGATITRVDLAVQGGGWDHQLAVTTPVTPGIVEESEAAYYRDTPRARLVLCYTNRLSPVATTRLTADLTGTPLAEVTLVPPVFADFSGFLLVGGWTTTLAEGECPAGAA